MNTRLLAMLLFLVSAGATTAAEPALSFSRDVRPILAANCFACHGPDEGSRKGELRLDTRAGATAKRDGSAAIVPGDVQRSQLIERLVTEDDNQRMPPKDTGKHLSAAQIEVLRKWIAAGANYERHWSFEPVAKSPPPEVKDSVWARTAIDRYVLAGLEGRDLTPSPEADGYTLIRRVYLDLLGMLPGIEATDEFVGDPRPDAYERLVDRVLANPAFGERWGRHWLDQARYADSHGYTNDNERTMWPYRDWVIRAINHDVPFDQFTIEQLAGDLLPGASLEQKIATGFHRNTLINTEGGVKADQFHDEQTKDRVDTTGSVWLGLTVGCAQCHNHKYDPVSQTEYYQLYAFFNSSVDNNSVPPLLAAPTPQQQARLRELAARRDELEKQLTSDPQRRDRQLAWEAALVKRQADTTEAESSGKKSDAWTVVELDGKSESGATFTALDDHSLLASGANADGDLYQITVRSPLTTIRSVRLEVLTHDKLPRRGPGRASNGNFVLSEFWFTTGDGRELRFAKAQADHSQPKYDVANTIDSNDDTGWAVNGSPEGGPNHNRTAWFVLASPLEVEKDHTLTFNLQHRKGQQPYNVGRLRLSLSSEEWVDAPEHGELAKLAAIPQGQRSKKDRQRLDNAFLRDDARLRPIFTQHQAVAKEHEELSRQVPTTMVMGELEQPRPTHVQARGDFLKPADAVKANVPGVLPPLAATGGSPTRLDLARWLVREDHPLTPRVRVNRVWMHLFGAGLVETENDFGTQGAPPADPALLDALASEDVRQGWSTKQLLRRIVASATYRQSSRSHAAGVAADPRNRLLWRQNRMRVEGEIVRDLALSASGLLANVIGGPSVYPPQPDGVYAFTQRAKFWRTSVGDDRYRRGMYTFYYRSAPHPMLTTFDAPAFYQTCTRRDRSNTPLQSLTVANDESIIEMTKALALRVFVEPSAEVAPDRRLERLFRLCMVRPPTEAEAAFLTRFFQGQREHFATRLEAAREIAPANLPANLTAQEAAAWVATARVLVNLDEFITRE